MPFTVGQHVVYNADAENVKPIEDRLYDIGKVIELDDTHALIYFPVSGHVSQILFENLAAAPNGVSPPYQTIPLERALAYYNMKNSIIPANNNTENAGNTENAITPLNVVRMPNMPVSVTAASQTNENAENFIHTLKPTKSLSINDAEELDDDSNSEAD